jgi:hypothetical protein
MPDEVMMLASSTISDIEDNTTISIVVLNTVHVQRFVKKLFFVLSYPIDLKIDARPEINFFLLSLTRSNKCILLRKVVMKFNELLKKLWRYHHPQFT